jgi:hypothetical protein
MVLRLKMSHMAVLCHPIAANLFGYGKHVASIFSF